MGGLIVVLGKQIVMFSNDARGDVVIKTRSLDECMVPGFDFQGEFNDTLERVEALARSLHRP